MAFLTVAGIDVPVAASGGSDQDEIEIGDRDRAEDGTAFASVRTRKRTWTVKTIAMDTTSAGTLRTALTAAPTATMTGTWVGGASITVLPKLGKETPIPVPGGHRVEMNFTLDEA